MLHVPVALITERLRGQTLEDDPHKTQREGTLQIEGKNVWVACDGDTSKDQDASTTTTTTIIPTNTTPTTTPNLLGRERGMTGSTSLPFLPPLHDNDRGVVAGSYQRISPPGAFPTPRLPTKPAAVRIRSSGQDYGFRCGDHGPRAFDTPPKKKQCRSLSVPVDSPPQGPCVEGARMWRPIPITALTPTPSGTSQPDPRTSGCAFMASPQEMRTFSGFTAVGSTTARLYRDFKVVGMGGGGGGGGTSSFPLAPSPLSVDSGRDTTSEPHTPSQSPIPRPASASSVRSSHAFSSGAWWGNSPGRFHGGEVFPSRSVSYEEQISMGFQTSAVGTASSGSSPCMVGSGMVAPLSPCRSKIPRCHSQPCVLHYRRYAKKRRRDDRPTLDFHKMTETAYMGKSATTPAQDIQRRRWGTELDCSMTIGGLMPIASSPRDTDLPAPPLPRVSDPHTARAADLYTAARASTDLTPARASMVDLAARAHLPSTPPQSDVSSGIDIREPVKLIGEEEEEEEEEELLEYQENSNCDCHRDSEREDSRGLFPLTDLDLEQIENH